MMLDLSDIWFIFLVDQRYILTIPAKAIMISLNIHCGVPSNGTATSTIIRDANHNIMRVLLISGLSDVLIDRYMLHANNILIYILMIYGLVISWYHKKIAISIAAYHQKVNTIRLFVLSLRYDMMIAIIDMMDIYIIWAIQ